MASSQRSKKESEKETESAGPILQNLNDLYLLELSQVYAQAVDAGLIEPASVGGVSICQIGFCHNHQLATLPVCPACGRGPEIRPTCWEMGKVSIHEVQQPDGSKKYAIRSDGNEMDAEGNWELAPTPSGQDSDYLKSHRWESLAQAAAAVQAARPL